MKRASIALIMMFCLCIVSAASANLLTNGSFEGQNMNGWTLKELAADVGKWNFPADEARDGNYAARFIDSGSGSRPNNAIAQKVYFPGGYQGDLKVSGWVKRYCLDSNYVLQPDWGWVAAAMYIDGTHGVDPATVVPLNMQTSNDTWTYFEHTFTNVTINSHMDFAIGWGLRGSGTANYRTFDVLLVDGLTVVPEPGSLLALGSGLVGLAGIAIRRRR